MQTGALQTGVTLFQSGIGWYCKVMQALLQSRAALCQYKKGEKLLESRASNLLKCGEIVIAKCSRYYLVEQLYYKVGRFLKKEESLQSRQVGIQ